MNIDVHIRINLISVKSYISLRLEPLQVNRYETWLNVRSLHINDKLETLWQASIRLKADGLGEILHNDEPNKETLKLILKEITNG
mgnify:CR=1 FL=1|tara:strand:+ start:20496 stop:20750 length:255 start_codon:yes stop_codon:yes gene_type:complete